MQETFEDPGIPESKPKVSPLTISLSLAVVVVILLSFWFLFESRQSRKTSAGQGSAASRMSAAEQAYVLKLEIGKVEMSRAENFLHQEVTTLSGELYNAGSQPILGLSLTTEFVDDMNQIVLRETRLVLGSPKSALGPGERRPFEISFENVPESWNRQTPAVRVSQLQLTPSKQ